MSGGSVLIVDDDGAMRALLGTLLRRAGYETAEAAGGDKALALATRRRPDLVVLDVCMPGLSGYELCRQFRDRYGEGLPIIFVSGERVETYDRVAGLLVGADDYVVKPFAPEELISRVRRLIDRSRSNGATAPLTEREREVLRLIAEGLEPAEIANTLVITPKTVAKHLEHVLAKLGVHTRAHAVAVALRAGML